FAAIMAARRNIRGGLWIAKAQQDLIRKPQERNRPRFVRRTSSLRGGLCSKVGRDCTFGNAQNRLSFFKSGSSTRWPALKPGANELRGIIAKKLFVRS